VAKLPTYREIINEEIQSTTDEDLHTRMFMDTTKFNGTVTCYLEVMAKVGAAESVDVEFHNAGHTVKASVTVTATSYTRYRSTSFTLSTGSYEYHLATNNISGETIDIRSARIYLIQEGDDTITNTEIAFDIGDADYVWSSSSYNQQMLEYPKYWKYDEAAWEPNIRTQGLTNVYLEVAYSVDNDKYDVNFYLVEDDGNFDGWTFITGVTGASSETPSRVRSGDLQSDLTDGRHYSLGFATEGSKSGRGVNIYAARLIIQTGGYGEIEKIQSQMLFGNTYLGSGTGLINFEHEWNPSDYDGYEFEAVHIGFCDLNYDPDFYIQNTDDTLEIEGSRVYAMVSSGETRLARQTTYGQYSTEPPDYVSLDDTNDAHGQSYEASGGKIKRVAFWLTKNNNPTGDAYAKIYASTGTPGTNATPTGAALATSEAVNVLTELDTAWSEWTFFEFSDPFETTDGTDYFVVLEYTNGSAVNTVDVAYDASPDLDTGQNRAYDAGGWSSNTTELCIDIQELCELPATTKSLDVYRSVTTFYYCGSALLFNWELVTAAQDLSIDETDAVETTGVTDVITDIQIPGPTLLVSEADAVESVAVTESVPRPDVVYDAAEIITTPSYTSEATAFNYRVVVVAADVDFDGEQMRVLLLGDDDNTLSITACSLGLRDASSEDYEVASFIKLTFDGQDGIVIPIGGEVYSDWVDFPSDTAEDYLVHIYLDAAHEFPQEAD